MESVAAELLSLLAEFGARPREDAETVNSWASQAHPGLSGLRAYLADHGHLVMISDLTIGPGDTPAVSQVTATVVVISGSYAEASTLAARVTERACGEWLALTGWTLDTQDSEPLDEGHVIRLTLNTTTPL